MFMRDLDLSYPYVAWHSGAEVLQLIWSIGNGSADDV